MTLIECLIESSVHLFGRAATEYDLLVTWIRLVLEILGPLFCEVSSRSKVSLYDPCSRIIPVRNSQGRLANVVQRQHAFVFGRQLQRVEVAQRQLLVRLLSDMLMPRTVSWLRVFRLASGVSESSLAENLNAWDFTTGLISISKPWKS